MDIKFFIQYCYQEFFLIIIHFKLPWLQFWLLLRGLQQSWWAEDTWVHPPAEVGPSGRQVHGDGTREPALGLPYLRLGEGQRGGQDRPGKRCSDAGTHGHEGESLSVRLSVCHTSLSLHSDSGRGSEGARIDLENTVLMQELMAMKVFTVKGQTFAVVLISLCSRSTIFPRN